MNAFRNFLILSSLIFGLAGCQTSAVYSNNPMGNNNSSQGFGLQTVDFEYAAKKAVEEFLASPASTRRDGTRWRVAIGEVVNDTTFKISTKSLTSRMRSMLIKSDKFTFSGFVGQDRTSFLNDSAQLAKSKLVDQNSVAKGGTAQAPNLQLNGEIRQRNNVSGNRSQQTLEYEFDFTATDVVTGQIAFNTIISIDKTGSNKNFAW